MRRWLPLLLVAGMAAVAGLAFGAVRLSPAEVWRALTDAGAAGAPIVRELRAPRVVLGFLIGGSLAVSGASLQALVRNPLADPYLLGLSGGAGLGAVLAIALGATGAWGVPLAAFIGTVAAVALVYRLGLAAGGRVDTRALLLAGVVVSGFAGAIMTAIIVLSPAEQLRDAFLWLLGGLGRASWRAVAVFAGYCAVPLLVLGWSARDLDLLSLGEEAAGHLGSDVERVKRRVVAATALLTAAAVAVSGMIGFVGLVVPHIVRLGRGPLHRGLLPAAFLLGGTMLVLADVIARSALAPLELPVGVVTALVGVPLFALLLRRSLA
ncbi:MAG TPA: iron ABC transporter permease [Gemmatimonadales bacterium]|nr:iron ABC transporter permease [Gemmatimonadales bacterium]